MTRALLRMLASETNKLQQAGLYKREAVWDDDSALDFTGYDYLGLGRDRRVGDAAAKAAAKHGHGVGDSRAFTGTREAHMDLEKALAGFFGVADAIVFGSGYLANIGLFDALFDSRDSVFCDAWVHPSVAEGVRLCGAHAVPYRNGDVEDLEDKLKRSQAARFRAIVTDGVFPFSGHVAPLGEICQLAERYEALVVVDDCLGVGVLGETGRGSCELRGAAKGVDVITGSFSKILGGASGGYVAGSREVVEWLRQKATTYLFSGALPPASVGAASCALDLVDRDEAPRETLSKRIGVARHSLEKAGFKVLGGEHAILTVPVGNVITLQKMVNQLLEAGVRVHGLCYPVVPEREARIRIQVSTLHTPAQLTQAADRFEQIGSALEVI